MFVANSGIHLKNSWWFFDKTVTEVQDLITLHGARLIDWEVYRDAGNKLTAGVLIEEVGDDDFFGFGSVGADISIPLGSGDYGEWTMNVGGNVLFLSSAAETANGGDDVEAIGYIGLSVSY